VVAGNSSAGQRDPFSRTFTLRVDLILPVAITSIGVAWLFGIEQFLPPMIILFAVLLLLAGGWRLSVPITGWLFLLFICLTLLSAASVPDLRGGVLFLKGLLNLTAALAACLIAANLANTRAGIPYLTKSLVLLSLVHFTFGLAFFLGWLPQSFEIPFPQIFPKSLSGSAFIQDQLIVRHIGFLDQPKMLLDRPRFSGFFLYNTDLGAVAVAMLPFGIGGLWILRGRWRAIAALSIITSVGLAVMSGSRTAVLLAAATAGMAGLEALNRSLQGAFFLVMAVLVLLAAVLILVVPWTGESLIVKAFLMTRPESFVDRVAMYRETISAIAERPVLGWGIQEMASRAGATHLRLGTHSELLNVAYRFGLLGLISYLATGLVFVFWFSSALSRLSDRAANQSVRDAVAVLGLSVMAVGLNATAHLMQWDANVYWISWCGVGFLHAVVASLEGKQLSSS
jgi:hypothetical protein